MALWEITLPADEQVELALEYGGFPKDWNLSSTSQGKPEISETYLCLENQRLFPYLLNVVPGDEGYPTTVEITLPAAMTAIPFGTEDAAVVAENRDGTKPGATRAITWAAFSTPETTSGRISRPAASPWRSTTAASTRRLWRPPGRRTL